MPGSKGEGSRGGKIVGHYKSGRAKYDPSGRVAKIASLAVAGVATAVSGGETAGRLLVKAKDHGRKAFNLELLSKTGTSVIGSTKATRGVKAAKTAAQVAKRAKLAKFAVRHKLVQKALNELHAGARMGAAVAATGFLYGAATSAIEGTKLDTDENKALAFTGAGIAAAFGTRLVEYKHVTTLGNAALTAIKKLRKPILR